MLIIIDDRKKNVIRLKAEEGEDITIEPATLPTYSKDGISAGEFIVKLKKFKNELSEIKEGIRKKVWCQDDNQTL